APAGGATLAAAMASTTDGKRSRFIGASLLEGPLRRVPRCGDVIVSALPARPSTALRPVVIGSPAHPLLGSRPRVRLHGVAACTRTLRPSRRRIGQLQSPLP